MQPLLKPIAAFVMLLPLVVAAAAPTAAPVRETASINSAVADLMKGGAPVGASQGAADKASDKTAEKPLLTPEQAVQKAIQAPAVVGEEALGKVGDASKGDKQAGANANATEKVAAPADKPAAASSAKDEVAFKKAGDPSSKVKAKEPVKVKKQSKASGFSWNEKATAGAAKEAAPKALRRDEYEVSDTDYNRFVFPVAVTQIISPAGPNLLSAPLYMAGNKHVLLKLAGATNRPVQVVAELEDNSVQEFYLKPAPIRGVTREMGVREFRSRMAREADASEAASSAAAGTPSAADMRLLEKFSMGQIPSEFEEETILPPEVHFERFWVKPVAVWSNGGNTRVEAWRLIGRPGLAATVAPPQFYRQGVRAVLLESDVVDGRTHPLLLLVTDNNEE